MSPAWGNVGDTGDDSPGPVRKDQQSSKSNLQVSRLFSQSKPSDFVILEADGESFYFPKSILVKRSGIMGIEMDFYSGFRKNKNKKKMPENKPTTIDFSDVKPAILGTYLHLAYCFETNVLDDDTQFMDNPNDLEFLFRLYQFTAWRVMDEKLEVWLYDKIVSFAPVLNDGEILERGAKLEWMKIYRDAFNALDKKDEKQKQLAVNISTNFCKYIPLHDMARDIHLIEDSTDFVCALFLRLAEGGSATEDSTDDGCNTRNATPSSSNLSDDRPGYGLFD